MRRILSALALVTLVVAPAAAGPKLTAEQRLAKAIEGRVAGEPVNCINLRRIHYSQVIDRTAILYEAGNVVYVNRPRAGAESLDQWDTMVTRPFNSQLCNIDTVDLYDTSSRIQTGFVLLGDFVPYRKVGRGR
jgi:hypothetical protein